MSREKPGYRDNLARLHEIFPDAEMLSAAQVAQFTGLSEQTVRRKFTLNRLTRRISKADLARQISAG